MRRHEWRHIVAVLVAAGLLCSLAPLAHAQVYRWVEDGRVHYGDQPPADAERVEGPGQARLPDAGNGGDASEDAAACREAEELLASYELAETITEESALGERRELDDEERERLIARQRERVDEACG